MSGVAWGSSIQFGQETSLFTPVFFSFLFRLAGIHGLVPAVIKTDSMDSDRFGLQLKNLKGPYFSIFIPSINSLRSNICIRKNDILS